MSPSCLEVVLHRTSVVTFLLFVQISVLSWANWILAIASYWPYREISSAPKGFTFFSQSLEIDFGRFHGAFNDLTFCTSAVVWPGRNLYRETPLETGVVISALHSGEVGAGTALTTWALILFVTDDLGSYQLFFSVLTTFFCPIRCCEVCAQTEAWPMTGYRQRCLWSIWTRRRTCQ